MSDVTHYYDGTEIAIKLRDKVCWEHDELPVEGEMEALEDNSFKVKWPDEGVI